MPTANSAQMRLVVLYGSQTGTAQDVAEQIWRESKRYGFEGPVLPMDDYGIEQLLEADFVVYVVATTGDGEEPDNMKSSWKFLLRRSLPNFLLQHQRYACLGLGDSSYAKFNYAAKRLNKRLQQLGATAILPLGTADDQHDHGYGAVTLPWIQSFFKATSELYPHILSKNEQIQAAASNLLKWQAEIITQQLPEADLVPINTLSWPLKENCHSFRLLENTRTTAVDHFQEVRLLRLESVKRLDWQPGDVFCVRPQNSPEQVDAFFQLARKHNWPFDASTLVQLRCNYADMHLPLAYAQPPSIGAVATYIWDFSAKPRQRAFELLALDCDNEREKEKLLEFTTVEGLEDLLQYINRPRRNILETLQDFPNAASKLQLSTMFELFSIIQPRSFSIASMPASGSLDLLVAVVEYKTKLSRPRLGLCSNWLKSLKPNDEIVGAIRSGTMLLPTDAATPLIMVGPGTGIAPFRSFIQHREQQIQAQLKIGKNIIFFGCRNRHKDYHFREDFEKWAQQKLSENFVAFSRDQEDKVYVQHLIKQQQDLLKQLIENENAYVYVAGSSLQMPKQVRAAFQEVLNDTEGRYIDKMVQAKRYQEETWS